MHCFLDRPIKQIPRNKAFTLIELLIVVLILNVLAALVVPLASNASTKSRQTAAATNLKMIGDAAIRYRVDHSDWPPDVHGGIWPASFTGYLPKFDFQKTPVGGRYDWDHPSNWHIGATIRSVPDPDDVLAIDALLDDGDLSKGNVRGNTNTVRYVVDRNGF